MAAAVASKGVLLPGFLKEFLAAPSASGKSKTATSGLRFFSTPKLFSDDSSSSDDSASDDSTSGEDLRKLFSGDVLDDLSDEASPLRLLLALMGSGATASRTGGFSSRGWSVSKEDGDAVQLKVAMPGLGKEHVKMQAQKDVLVIKGEGDKDGDSDKGSTRYSYRIRLSSQAFKMDQITAEMKNGVLCVTVPKIKDEERKDVFDIKIE